MVLRLLRQAANCFQFDFDKVIKAAVANLWAFYNKSHDSIWNKGITKSYEIQLWMDFIFGKEKYLWESYDLCSSVYSYHSFDLKAFIPIPALLLHILSSMKARFVCLMNRAFKPHSEDAVPAIMSCQHHPSLRRSEEDKHIICHWFISNLGNPVHHLIHHRLLTDGGRRFGIYWNLHKWINKNIEINVQMNIIEMSESTDCAALYY